MKIGDAHLTDAQVSEYHQATLKPEELLAASDHAAQCAECRQRLAGSSSQRNRRHSFLETGEPRFHLSYEQLRDHLKGALDRYDREIAEEHLQDCAMCRGEFEDLARFRKHLQTGPAAVESEAIAEEQAPAPTQRTKMEAPWWDGLMAVWRQLSSHWVLAGGLATAILLACLILPGVMNHPGKGSTSEIASNSQWKREDETSAGPPSPDILNDGDLRITVSNVGQAPVLPATWPVGLRQDVDKLLRGKTLSSLAPAEDDPFRMSAPLGEKYTLVDVRAVSPDSHLAMGLAYWKAGDREAARKEFEEFAAQNPGSRFADRLRRESQESPK